MIDEQFDQMTDEQREEWRQSLRADERLILDVPYGYRHTFIIASYIKRALTTEKMTVGDRLELLEGLSRMVDNYFTAERLALIKPADDISAEMIEEALKLDVVAGEHDQRSFDILTSGEVFGNLVRLNPTIMDAIKRAHQGRQT